MSAAFRVLSPETCLSRLASFTKTGKYLNAHDIGVERPSKVGVHDFIWCFGMSAVTTIAESFGLHFHADAAEHFEGHRGMNYIDQTACFQVLSWQQDRCGLRCRAIGSV